MFFVIFKKYFYIFWLKHFLFYFPLQVITKLKILEMFVGERCVDWHVLYGVRHMFFCFYISNHETIFFNFDIHNTAKNVFFFENMKTK